MARFEVEKIYRRNDSGFDPVAVTKRTEKTIWVQCVTDKHSWSMRVRHWYDGGEYAVDYQVPHKYRDMMMFDAENEVEEEQP